MFLKNAIVAFFLVTKKCLLLFYKKLIYNLVMKGGVNMTAQSILNEEMTATACGTACGASDDTETKEAPTACGSACGAGE
jgi:ACGX-repeat protein